MGYRIKNYNLDELHRIAAPGSVAASLFWVLPVGNWDQGDLEDMWRRFTQGGNQCSDYGLLLIKEAGRKSSEHAAISLATAGARLSDLMPEGAERFARPSAFDDESPKLFVLSGGYPQPGWGVLVDWPLKVRSFEQLIRSVNDRLSTDPKFLHGLRAFEEAARSFHDWQKLREPANPIDFSSLELKSIGAERVDGLLWDAEDALKGPDFRAVEEKLSAAADALRHAAWLELDQEGLRGLREAGSTLSEALSLNAVGLDVLATEVIPKRDAVIAGSISRETAFQACSCETAKRALSASLKLQKRGNFESASEVIRWVQQTVAGQPTQLEASISEVRQDIAAKLGKRRAAKADIERTNKRLFESWRERSSAARVSFHESVEETSKLQWDMGPRFLVEFEDICRDQGLKPHPVPWDPARMLGWKIMVRSIEVTVFDLQVAARELSPATANNAGAREMMAPLDGSYFTDYVHYVAISKPGVPARDVARDLVSRLIRPAQMISLIKLHGRQVSEPSSPVASHLADELLDCFGWRKSDETRETPLAACLKPFNDPAATLDEQLSGNELRIRLESFCKDLLDVVVANLNYNEAEVWGLIEERAPMYRPSSKPRDWGDEVRHLSLGGAAILIPALGPISIPSREEQIGELASALRDLTKHLNETSHHPYTPVEIQRVTLSIRQLLDSATACLGELPWHLETSFVYGDQPKIVSGEAWSHSSATPRLLRVILWNRSPADRHILLWNKTGRNPIITEPMFIRRPERP